MQFTGFGALALGADAAFAQEMHELTVAYYAEMRKSAAFAEAPSALPYCYSSEKPSKGLLTAVLPKENAKSAPVIFFLHGTGGSMLMPIHFLAETFPNHVIIAPAFGTTCGKAPPEYLAEALDAARDQLGIRKSPPVLVGLSGGGFGGFREYARNYPKYAAYVCLAAYPVSYTHLTLPTISDV